MNNDLKLKAKNLFFQTDLNKTQIANILNISRRSLHYWVRTENWERLKHSAEHMPAILAENLYHILGKLTEHHLSETRRLDPITPKEVDALHKLVRTIDKLKNRSTLNENQETFALFIDKLKNTNPEMATAIAPQIDEFLSYRAAIGRQTLSPHTFNSIGCYEPKEPDHKENQLDNKEYFEEQIKNETQTNNNKNNLNNYSSSFPTMIHRMSTESIRYNAPEYFQQPNHTSAHTTPTDNEDYYQPQPTNETTNPEIQMENQENNEPQFQLNNNENSEQQVITETNNQELSNVEINDLIKQLRDSIPTQPKTKKTPPPLPTEKIHWTKLYPPIPDSQPLTSIYNP